MTAFRRARAITVKVVAALAVGTGFLAGPPIAAGLTLTVTPATSCRSGQLDPFLVSSNAPYFTFRCVGMFELAGDPLGPAGGGSYVVA